jgi:Protein of unknown function (DUF3723)
MDRKKQARAETKEQVVLERRFGSYRGAALVRLEVLSFSADAVRRLRKNNVARLVRIYRTQGCLRLHPIHRIKAVITARQLSDALQISNCTESKLREPASRPPELIFPPGVRLHCLSGLHRVEAGKRWLKAPKRSWVVELFDPGGLAISRKCSFTHSVQRR